MRIPPYWTKGTYTNYDVNGKEMTFTAWGWSFEDIQEARRDATARASRIFQHFANGSPLQRYPYAANPLREEIVEEINSGNQQLGIITRNRYGALILNSASVLFADIDFPENAGKGGLLKKFFKAKEGSDDPVTATTERVKMWASANPKVSFRLYRTYAGLRLIATNKLYEAGSSETDAILAALGSDPLYQRLTRNQASFRARLTPKPWRCQMKNPPNEFPWEDSMAEQRYRQWQQQYTNKITGYSTCTLIEEMGNSPRIDEIEEIIRIHDRHVMNGNNPLA